MEKKKISPWAHFIAGGFGGTVGAVITCPLEVVKTRLQSSMFKQDGGKSLRSMLHDIYRNEGITGLWRGLGPNLVGVVPARAIYFSSYASSKHYFLSKFQVGPDGKEPAAIHFMSAIVAGVATATTTNPIWLIKTRMQLQSTERNSSMTTTAAVPTSTGKTSKTKTSTQRISSAGISTASGQQTAYYRNSFDCLRKVVKQEGFTGLFHGLSASYLGIIEGTLQWLAYEQLKATHYKSSEDANTAEKMTSTFMAAGLAKFFAAITTYPHEVLRTRLRQAECVTEMVNGRELTTYKAKYNGIIHVCRSILRDEGILAFYGGLSAHLLRTVPNAAIMFLCYESVVYFLE